MEYKRGDRVVITGVRTAPWLTIEGLVTSAKDWEDEDGWHLELRTDAGRIIFWNERADGGIATAIGPRAVIDGLLDRMKWAARQFASEPGASHKIEEDQAVQAIRDYVTELIRERDSWRKAWESTRQNIP